MPICTASVMPSRAPSGAGAQPATPDEAWRSWLTTPPRPRRCARTGRVLLVCYEFPPTAGSGAQRPAKLVKYLHRLGWSVEVVTAAHERFPWRDDSLSADVPANCLVHRVPGWEPACLARSVVRLPRWLESRGHLPAGRSDWLEDRIYWRLLRVTVALGRGNGQSFWIPAAVRKGLRLHRARPFDAVISTGPPHCFHAAGFRIARQAGVPWVADVRDPLVTDVNRRPDVRAHRAGLLLEQMVLRHADRIVTTCRSLAEDLSGRRTKHEPGSVCTITNGFDREDILAALASEPAPISERDACTFVFAGACYGRLDLAALVEPMRQVLERHPEWHGRVRLLVAGLQDRQQAERLRRTRPEWMQLLGYMSHPDVINLIMGASCSVLLLPDGQHGRQVIPGKTFELLALPRHILALAPPGGETESVLREAGGATVVPYETPDRIEAAVEEIIRGHFAGRLTSQRDWSVVDRYDRFVLAGEYARCLAEIAEERSRMP